MPHLRPSLFKVSKETSLSKNKKKMKPTNIHKISKAISSIRGFFVSMEIQYNSNLNTCMYSNGNCNKPKRQNSKTT